MTGDPAERPPSDRHRSDPDEARRRAALDEIFKAGREARRIGQPQGENPYAAGSDERQEWDAGWRATVDLADEDGEDSNDLRN